MARLSAKHRIEILNMICYGYQTQTLIYNLFNNKYPKRPITRSTVSNVEEKCRTLGTVVDNEKGH